MSKYEDIQFYLLTCGSEIYLKIQKACTFIILTLYHLEKFSQGAIQCFDQPNSLYHSYKYDHRFPIRNSVGVTTAVVDNTGIGSKITNYIYNGWKTFIQTHFIVHALRIQLLSSCQLLPQRSIASLTSLQTGQIVGQIESLILVVPNIKVKRVNNV